MTGQDTGTIKVQIVDPAQMLLKRELERLVMNAVPSQYFERPPYKAKYADEKRQSGWAYVANRDGFNCLLFPDRPGAKFTDFETAERIAAKWNEAT